MPASNSARTVDVKPTELCAFLAEIVRAKKTPNRPLIIGINGVDGSGKTTLARNLRDELAAAGTPVCPIAVDDFHHPKARRYARGELSPEAFYNDAIDFDALEKSALKPAFEARSFPAQIQTKSLDLASDKTDARFSSIDADTILLVEGVFLFRPELSAYIHLKIFVEANFDTTLARARLRDREALGTEAQIITRYTKKYIPGQKLYLQAVDPAARADIVIDNDDFNDPKITRRQTPPGKDIA
jgi:uridine kinase